MSDVTTFEEVLDKEHKLIYTNVGDSMYPLIQEGRDLIVIEKCNGRMKRFEIPLYKRDNGKYVLHRIIKVRDEDYLTCGDNRWALESGVTDRHIIGKLTKVIRDGKEISFDSANYKLYVFLWCRLFPIRAAIFWVRDLPKRVVKKIRRKQDRNHQL